MSVEKAADHENIMNPEQCLAKSDSGFSKNTNIEEDEDEDNEDLVKEELTLEKAEILFDKRIAFATAGAAAFDDHDYITDDEDFDEIIKSKNITSDGESEFIIL